MSTPPIVSSSSSSSSPNKHFTRPFYPKAIYNVIVTMAYKTQNARKKIPAHLPEFADMALKMLNEKFIGVKWQHSPVQRDGIIMFCAESTIAESAVFKLVRGQLETAIFLFHKKAEEEYGVKEKEFWFNANLEQLYGAKLGDML